MRVAVGTTKVFPCCSSVFTQFWHLFKAVANKQNKASTTNAISWSNRGEIFVYQIRLCSRAKLRVNSTRRGYRRRLVLSHLLGLLRYFKIRYGVSSFQWCRPVYKPDKWRNETVNRTEKWTFRASTLCSTSTWTLWKYTLPRPCPSDLCSSREMEC